MEPAKAIEPIYKNNLGPTVQDKGHISAHVKASDRLSYVMIIITRASVMNEASFIFYLAVLDSFYLHSQKKRKT